MLINNKTGKISFILFAALLIGVGLLTIAKAEASPVEENKQEDNEAKDELVRRDEYDATGAEDDGIEMIDIEPSAYALSDEEVDPNYEYADEDDMLVF